MTFESVRCSRLRVDNLAGLQRRRSLSVPNFPQPVSEADTFKRRFGGRVSFKKSHRGRRALVSRVVAAEYFVWKTHFTAGNGVELSWKVLGFFRSSKLKCPPSLSRLSRTKI